MVRDISSVSYAMSQPLWVIDTAFYAHTGSVSVLCCSQVGTHSIMRFIDFFNIMCTHLNYVHVQCLPKLHTHIHYVESALHNDFSTALSYNLPVTLELTKHNINIRNRILNAQVSTTISLELHTKVHSDHEF
jgi:hypothetical protein